jgi:hypothetical protein
MLLALIKLSINPSFRNLGKYPFYFYPWIFFPCLCRKAKLIISLQKIRKNERYSFQ